MDRTSGEQPVPSLVRLLCTATIGRRFCLLLHPASSGETLLSHLQRRSGATGPVLGASDAWWFSVELFRAVAALRRAGVVSGDVSHNNVLVDVEQKTVLLVDLGLGGTTEEEWPSELAGTPGSMPFERALGARSIVSDSDTFSASSVVLTAFLGRSPFCLMHGSPPSSQAALRKKVVADLRRTSGTPSRGQLEAMGDIRFGSIATEGNVRLDRSVRRQLEDDGRYTDAEELNALVDLADRGCAIAPSDRSHPMAMLALCLGRAAYADILRLTPFSEREADDAREAVGGGQEEFAANFACMLPSRTNNNNHQ